MPQLLANGNITNHHLWSECLEFCKNGSCAGWQSGRNLTHDDAPLQQSRRDSLSAGSASFFITSGAGCILSQHVWGVLCPLRPDTHTHTPALRRRTLYKQILPNSAKHSSAGGPFWHDFWCGWDSTTTHKVESGTFPPPTPTAPFLLHRDIDHVANVVFNECVYFMATFPYIPGASDWGRGATVAAFHYARKPELEQCRCVYSCIIITYFQ